MRKKHTNDRLYNNNVNYRKWNPRETVEKLLAKLKLEDNVEYVPIKHNSLYWNDPLNPQHLNVDTNPLLTGVENSDIKHVKDRYVGCFKYFSEGIQAVMKASEIMKEIFSFVVDDVNPKDDYAYQDWATIALQETIYWRGPINVERLLISQRIIHMANNEVFYRNWDGVILCWRRKTYKPRSGWVFWILLPDHDYKEPEVEKTLASRLEQNGFKREPLEPDEIKALPKQKKTLGGKLNGGNTRRTGSNPGSNI